MSLRKTFKTDQTAEVEGVWFDVGINEHNNKPERVKLSRMSRTNKKYAKELERVTRPHQSAIQNEALDNDLGNKLLREVFVDTVILDWDNIPKSELTGNSEDSELLEFTRENVLALFDELPELYDDWEIKAKKASGFREKEVETNAKN